MTPATFGRYIVINPLPSGGMADLYLAHDPVLNRDVVVKVPKVERLTPGGRRRFEREAQSVAGLANCPEIVPLYDFGEQDGVPYLVMRYMSGGTLAERIEQGTFSLEQAVPVIERVARALDHAHGKGIIHRDVKPANILFDADDNAYLSDFGIATEPDPDPGAETAVSETRMRLTAVGSSSGTPGYRSPEQALGEDDLDGRSDVYSLGIVLFEMLAGKVPAQAQVPLIADYRDDLPAATQHPFNQALAKDRIVRYATAAELAADLKKLIAGVLLPADARPPTPAPIKSRQTPTPPTPRPAANRRPSPLLWAGSGALALLLLLALVLPGFGRGGGGGRATPTLGSFGGAGEAATEQATSPPASTSAGVAVDVEETSTPAKARIVVTSTPTSTRRARIIIITPASTRAPKPTTRSIVATAAAVTTPVLVAPVAPTATIVDGDSDGDNVPNSIDQCPYEFQGGIPDPNRPGCPLDSDGDGLMDDEDECVFVPASPDANPDEPGCPPDSDGDGWKDHDDLCPNENAGLYPDPNRPGCPLPTPTLYPTSYPED